MMKYSLLITALLLSACAAPVTDSPQKVVIQRDPIERPVLTLPPVDKYVANPVNWIIVTPENVDEVFAEITKSGKPAALFALTDSGYENIVINTQSSLRVILQQRAQIDGYRRYYVTTDRNIQEFNSQFTWESTTGL